MRGRPEGQFVLNLAIVCDKFSSFQFLLNLVRFSPFGGSLRLGVPSLWGFP